MGIPYSESVEHDQVVKESANTYLSIAQSRGLIVDVNTSDARNRSVGGTNPIYPDVVVWQPSVPGSQSGTAVTVEAIETPSSLAQNIDQLQKIGSLQIPFAIVVPDIYSGTIKSFLQQNGVRFDRLQSYRYNPATGSYIFSDIR